jgi:hypothetical protein
MLKYLGIVVLVFGSACGKGDKCERAYDKVAPMMKAMAKEGKEDKDDRSKMVAECQADLKKHPEREKMLDCILGVSGELTMDKMMECSKEEKAERHKMKDEGGGGGGADMAEAMAKMTEFKDKMCACADTACAQKVSDDMTKWSTEQAKNMKEPPKMSEEDTKKMTQIGEDLGKCMQKAMTPATGTTPPATK